MDKSSYEYTRNLLVQQRKKLMDTLEAQGDFPDAKLIEAYENNKRRIIDLDDASKLANTTTEGKEPKKP